MSFTAALYRRYSKTGTCLQAALSKLAQPNAGESRATASLAGQMPGSQTSSPWASEPSGSFSTSPGTCSNLRRLSGSQRGRRSRCRKAEPETWKRNHRENCPNVAPPIRIERGCDVSREVVAREIGSASALRSSRFASYPVPSSHLLGTAPPLTLFWAA
jgi:hypothetical protein